MVAGATGALGTELVRSLAERGHEVIAMVRRSGDARLDAVRHMLCDERVADVSDPSGLRAACAGADVVVSTVGLTRPTRSVTFEQVDHQGNLALLDAAAQEGVGHFHFVSLAGIDDPGHARVPMMVAKRAFEIDLQAGPIAWSISRPSGFFWNYGVILQMVREHGTAWLVGDGAACTTPVDERDLADAIADRLCEPEAIFTVGGPEDLSFREVAEMAFRVLGRPERIHHVPPSLARSALAVVRPFDPARYGLGAFATWVMVTGATADHVGERALEPWMAENRDRDFGPL